MQVTPYLPARGTGPKEQLPAGASELARAQGTAAEPAVQEAENGLRSAEGAGVPRRVLRSWSPGRQQRIDSARQARDYLRQLAGQLQRLKDQISAQLSAARRQVEGASQDRVAASPQPQDDVSWEQTFQELDQLWSERQQRGVSLLDGQLRYQASGAAQQRFRLRGMDAQSLRSGAREVLAFSLAGRAGATTSAAVDPRDGTEANVARLDQALSPLGVRVGLDEQGQPIFSADEVAWPKIRDGLTVRGEGRRFAAGQHNKVRAEVEAGAVQPHAWKTLAKDGAGLRQVLHAVTRALDRVKEAQREVSRALAEATAEMARAEDPAQAVFVEAFEDMAQEPDYSVYEQVAPALNGISRERVVALLSWSAGPAAGL